MNRDEASDPGAVAAAIRRDFQLLIDAFSRQAELFDDAALEVMTPLANAKRAAERGVEISERLLKRITGRAPE